KDPCLLSRRLAAVLVSGGSCRYHARRFVGALAVRQSEGAGTLESRRMGRRRFRVLRTETIRGSSAPHERGEDDYSERVRHLLSPRIIAAAAAQRSGGGLLPRMRAAVEREERAGDDLARAGL